MARREQVWWHEACAFADKFSSGEVCAREARLGNPWPLIERLQSGKRLTRHERNFVAQLLADSSRSRGRAFNEVLNTITARGYCEVRLAEGYSKKAAVAQLESKLGISRRAVYYRLRGRRSSSAKFPANLAPLF